MTEEEKSRLPGKWNVACSATFLGKKIHSFHKSHTYCHGNKTGSVALVKGISGSTKAKMHICLFQLC